MWLHATAETPLYEHDDKQVGNLLKDELLGANKLTNLLGSD